MKRSANPQISVDISRRIPFGGDERLSTAVDADTWLTPRWILDQLGSFDLDPCAASGNALWVAPRFYTKADDGLQRGWFGRVFMNPPFSNTVPWIVRHAAHDGGGVSLVPASVESVIWREVVWVRSAGVLLLHGRTRFANPDGSTTTGRPLRSIALIAWTQEDLDVLRMCAIAGVLVEKWSQR